MSAPRNLSDLKKSSKNSLTNMRQAVEEVFSKKKTIYKKDERFWEPTVDKAGNGSALIRFLPEPAGEDHPFVKIWDHGFQGPSGLWYIENSRTSILPHFSHEDPVHIWTQPLWKGSEADRAKARKYGRRLHYIANILVVNDPGNPENNGKVFLYKFGNSIFKILGDAAAELKEPEFPGDEPEDRTPYNPFDAYAGGALRLRIRKDEVSGQRSYLKSEMDKHPSKLAKTDDEINAIWQQEYPLIPFVTDGPLYKSYAELEAKFHKVMGMNPAEARNSVIIEDERSHKGSARSTIDTASIIEEDTPWVDDDEGDIAKFKQSLLDD